MTLAIRSLEQCEQVIEAGLASFVEVGLALLEIRDRRLYKDTYERFDDYCQERWGWHRAHAYRMIASGEVIGALSPIGDIPPPTTESQARALAPLRSDPEKMNQAWEGAVRESGGKPTAKDVADSVAKVTTHVEADPALILARWQHNFSKALNRAYDFMAFEPETVAQNIDEADVKSLEMLQRSVTQFCQKVLALRPKPFDVIQGGRG